MTALSKWALLCRFHEGIGVATDVFNSLIKLGDSLNQKHIATLIQLQILRIVKHL